MYALGNRTDLNVESSKSASGMAMIKNLAGTLRARGVIWFVDSVTGNDNEDGRTWGSALATITEAVTRVGAGDTILLRGNFTEHVTTPLGIPHVTIVGMGNLPQHADTHPLNTNKVTNSWRSTGNNPLLTLRQPGWKLQNILFVPNSANYAIRMERTGVEDATEQDASHLAVEGCRFAAGAGGITDVGGCAGVNILNSVFHGQTAYAMLGVGNIGAGQGMWNVRGNRFLDFTNGVKCAFWQSVIEGNFFHDGGTPTSTVVLNTVNAIQGNNFVVNNFFQTTSANFNSPDIEGNATDVWNNTSIDGTTNMIGREIGQPA